MELRGKLNSFLNANGYAQSNNLYLHYSRNCLIVNYDAEVNKA